MQSKTPLLVKDRMTREPHTISSAEPIGKAAELFDRFEIRHLPVCDGGKVVGMITHRDLRRAHPVSAHVDPAQHEAYLKETKVRQIMASPALTVAPGAPMKDAVQIFIETKFGALPVVEDGKLIGILSPIDALKTLLDLL